MTAEGWLEWRLVAGWDDIENCDSISDMHVQRFKVKETGPHRIPCADGSLSKFVVPRHPSPSDSFY